ncbi:MAG: sulfur carrier protein ThiS [Sulfitobacter litoralis]|jgi:sulfur carrier protein|uniref:Sulfur carrier protein n=2 Tax=root TaxID=1 RepID=A0A1H0PMT2_9RHOB|nr:MULTISPECIES: sulfur carrier protein ThiS [Sulfitobacter]MBQ0717684.1 sulfur carrier protein ThiS [Sulfitobacter litoralis]MBQ0765030.1 sulfur carrier protein ThiS [Sulfitobacter litoralis]MBQ0801992.1 sulfur carrier protein ThiS [Sulfitobacter litoralis]MCF7726098.1 sulfur carrier protein ThiS [Sulfitobacter sp. M22]MCF7777475.1 sulfur carrier protein ThiS [Sulfitobacter sp. M220]|tara:strand:- start:6918 stop:7115 length:198 start_codon:yes stop_codon:yes gene_type:complete
MKLQLNGAPLHSDATTLAALLEAEGFGGAKVATAVNGSFVPATLRATHPLNSGDSIEVLAPMQGG